MKSLSGKEFAKILSGKGWELKRINGSHHIYMLKGNPARISIPIHGTKPLKIGMLKHFMKIANLREEDL